MAPASRDRSILALRRWRCDRAAPAHAAVRTGTGNVYHLQRMRPLVEQRRSAMHTKAARGFSFFIREASDLAFAENAHLAPPRSYIGRIGRTAQPGWPSNIVPGPTRRYIDLEAHPSPAALTGRSHGRSLRILIFAAPASCLPRAASGLHDPLALGGEHSASSLQNLAGDLTGGDTTDGALRDPWKSVRRRPQDRLDQPPGIEVLRPAHHLFRPSLPRRSHE